MSHKLRRAVCLLCKDYNLSTVTQHFRICRVRSWVADSVFGYVFDCSKEQYNSIMLNPVQIGKLCS